MGLKSGRKKAVFVSARSAFPNGAANAERQRLKVNTPKASGSFVQAQLFAMTVTEDGVGDATKKSDTEILSQACGNWQMVLRRIAAGSAQEEAAHLECGLVPTSAAS